MAGFWGRKGALLSVASMAALSAGAFAQEVDDEQQLSEPIVLAGIDTISVYATRNPITAFDYPGQVTVIDRTVIEDFNASTIADIFDVAPGAKIGGGPRRSGQTPDIRGLSGEGVLILFDGARQSYLSGHDGRFFIDPDLIQAVEVVRGPSSALYGSGALGGVIAVRTVTASDLLDDGETAMVKAGGGFQSVNDEWRISATSAWRSDDERTDVVGNFTFRTSGDIDLGSGLALPSDDEAVSSLIKTTFRANDDLTLSASWQRYGADSVDPNNPQGNNIAVSGNENVLRDIDSNTLQGKVSYAPSGSNLIDLNLVGYYTRNVVDEEEVDTTRAISRAVDTLGVSLDNRSSFSLGDGVDLTLTYGGEFYRDEQVGLDNTTADGTRGGVPNATSKFYGAFAQAEFALANPFGAPGILTVIPGVRWDKFENDAVGEVSTDNEATSPKVGVSYKPVKELIVFGNWGEAFRAPSFNETYADGIHFEIPNFSVPGPFGQFGPPAFVTNFFIPNPDLVPEESESWEVGAGFDLVNIITDGDSLIAKGSYFSSDVTNLIDLEVEIPFTCFLTADQLFPGAPVCGSGEAFGNYSRNVNVTNAELTGVEIEVQYDSTYFYTRANFATIDGRNTDTDEFVGILSPDTFFVDAGVKFPAADLKVGGRLNVASDFDAVNDPVDARDGYVVGDVYAVWTPMGSALEGLRVDLGVDNIADTDYEIVAAGVSQPGRNFKAAISWRQGF